MKRTSMLALAATAMLGLSACGGSSDPMASSQSSTSSASSSQVSGSVVVGSAKFSESVLLANIYAGALKAAGVDASTKLNIGAREIYLKALEDGSIDLIPEYTGALALYYDPNFDKTNPDEVYAALPGLIPDTFTVLDKSVAQDKDSMVVTKETADSKQLATVADLETVAGSMTLGAPPEFRERPQGIPGLKRLYGITFGDFRPLSSGQVTVQALKNGQVDVANIFSTDPAIAVNNFVVLEDTKSLFGSQNMVPLVRADKADLVKETLNKVSAALTTANVTDMLKATDIDKQDPEAVAAAFLKDNGLG